MQVINIYIKMHVILVLRYKLNRYVSVFESKYTKIKDLIDRGLEFTKGLIRNKNNIFWNDVLESWILICNKQNQT